MAPKAKKKAASKAKAEAKPKASAEVKASAKPKATNILALAGLDQVQSAKAAERKKHLQLFQDKETYHCTMCQLREPTSENRAVATSEGGAGYGSITLQKCATVGCQRASLDALHGSTCCRSCGRSGGSVHLHDCDMKAQASALSLTQPALGDAHFAFRTISCVSLHGAAYSGDLVAVRRLLATRVDPGAADELGITPLHLAVEADSRPVVEALLAARASPNVCTGTVRQAGTTGGKTLRSASIHDRRESIVACLLEASASLVAPEGGGVVPLQLAVHAEEKKSHAEATAEEAWALEEISEVQPDLRKNVGTLLKKQVTLENKVVLVTATLLGNTTTISAFEQKSGNIYNIRFENRPDMPEEDILAEVSSTLRVQSAANFDMTMFT